MRFWRVFDFQINYMLYWRFHFEKGIPINCSFTHYELEHIYWILDLDEVHSIWVIWTSGLQSRWRTTPWYWRNYTKRQLLLCWSGGHRGREAFGKRCPDHVGRETRPTKSEYINTRFYSCRMKFDHIINTTTDSRRCLISIVGSSVCKWGILTYIGAEIIDLGTGHKFDTLAKFPGDTLLQFLGVLINFSWIFFVKIGKILKNI